jgi:nicotinate-nucleotide pyrophosphorylase (carboxylating)
VSLRQSVRDSLAQAALDPDAVESLVRAALAEDLAFGPDVTTLATVPEDAVSRGQFVAREPGVIAGVLVAAAVLDCALGAEVALTVLTEDGTQVRAGQRLLTAVGTTGGLLTAERTALNLLCHLSGIATLTEQWVRAVRGTGAAIRDTRKTLPGLRSLQKYAVRRGGGVNHRMGLGDAALIKDNHIVAAGSLPAALTAVRRASPGLLVQVECDTLDQVGQAIQAGAQHLLLDNMTVPQLAEAVRLAQAAGVTTLEASGGLSLESAELVARTGVDYLAVGALTHSVRALDIGFDLEG